MLVFTAIIVNMVIVIDIVYLLISVYLSDKNHGVILLPEGLIESIPEVFALLQVTNTFNTVISIIFGPLVFFFPVNT